MVGDVFVSAACVAYYGAFTSVYRKILVQEWAEGCRQLEIPVTENMTLSTVLADPFEIRQWNSDGLPKDQVRACFKGISRFAVKCRIIACPPFMNFGKRRLRVR